MRKLIVVCRFYGPIDLADDRENAERYRDVKSAALPYCQVLLSHGTNVRHAPLGTVRSIADGNRLMAAFTKAFPDWKFMISTLLSAPDEEVVFVPHDAPVSRDSFATRLTVRFDRIPDVAS